VSPKLPSDRDQACRCITVRTAPGPYPGGINLSYRDRGKDGTQ